MRTNGSTRTISRAGSVVGYEIDTRSRKGFFGKNPIAIPRRDGCRRVRCSTWWLRRWYSIRGTASGIPLTAFASRRCAVARAKKIILRYRLGLVSLIISLKLALSRSNDAVIYLRQLHASRARDEGRLARRSSGERFVTTGDVWEIVSFLGEGNSASSFNDRQWPSLAIDLSIYLYLRKSMPFIQTNLN